jgi:hypothetical protein
MLVNTVEALAHAAVLSRPELLATDAYVEEVSTLVLRYLQPAAPSSPRKTPRARA